MRVQGGTCLTNSLRVVNLSRRLLLFKYRRHVKKQRLTDNEVADTFKRLASAGSVEMAPELFHAAIRRDLDVVLTAGVRWASAGRAIPL